jgi:hypothetical protein
MFVPALAVDWLVQRMKGSNKLLVALVVGTAFLAATVAAHWPYGRFMISPLAKNWIFGTSYFPYMQAPSAYHFFYEFFSEPAKVFWERMGIAWLASILSTLAGLQCGDWLQRLKR